MPRVAATVSVAALVRALRKEAREAEVERMGMINIEDRAFWEGQRGGLLSAVMLVRSIASRPARAPKKPAAKRGRRK